MIQLTTVKGTYAKRISNLLSKIALYLDSDESTAKNAIRVMCGKVKKNTTSHVYLTRSTESINVSLENDYAANSIAIKVFNDGKQISCLDVITLNFPSISKVLLNEYIESSDQKSFKEKYSDYIK
jgi:hypothetical protein